jgi:hypothetical protein
MYLLDSHKECNSIFQAIYNEDFTMEIRDAIMDDIIAHHQAGGAALRDIVLKTVLSHCLDIGMEEFTDSDFQKFKSKYEESMRLARTYFHRHHGNFQEQLYSIIGAKRS